MKTQSDPNGATLKKSNTGRKNHYLTDTEVFPHEQVRDALFHVQDMLERSQIQFILLDELAERLAYSEDPLLDAAEVAVGVRAQDFSDSGSSTLRSLIPDAGWKEFVHGEEISNLAYTHGSVPIVIWLIHNDLDVFKFPDTRFYYQTEFRIPNPFKTYWRKRDLVK